MTCRVLAAVAVWATMVTGCVSGSTHKTTLAELEEARKASNQTTAALESFQKEAATDITALEQEQGSFVRELLTANNSLAQTQTELESARYHLGNEQQSRRDAENQLAKLQDEHQELEQVSSDLQQERDLLQTSVEDFRQRLETTQQALASRKTAVTGAQDRIAGLEQEKVQVLADLTETGDQARMLATELRAEQAKIAALQQAAADREALAAQTTALEGELDQAKAQMNTLTTELAMLSDVAARMRQERDDLTAQVQNQQETIQTMEQDLAMLGQQEVQLEAQLEEQVERVKAEKARIEGERAAKEAEIRRLTQTQEELNKSLQDEIAKGDIRIQRVRDQLRINMVDSILFDSGRAQVKPDGLEVLKRVSEILKDVANKQIRIEGHTDIVPIGPKIVGRFPTNWELSTARATSVVRYFIDKGGVRETTLSAVGYAYNQPVASNDTKEGRAANRRIEIVLYPKDLSEIISF